MNELGQLKKIALREVWNHEAHDFTRWLEKEENIQLLSDEIGISLIDVRSEQSIGRYQVDLVGMDEDSQQKVIIENQLEHSDHKHLGQLITYASGYDASIIIWIVKEEREEHRNAMEWLNNHTSSELSFFLIRMELWQIGDSPFAPKFHVIVEPNDWAKEIKSTPNRSKELSDTKLLQFEFWQQFIEYARNNQTSLKIGRKARAQHYYNISFGTSEANIGLTVNSRDNIISSTIYIPKSAELYRRFESKSSEIESKLGFELEWMELEEKDAFRVKIEKGGSDFTLQDNWPTYFQWLQEHAEKMANVFAKYL